MDRPTLKTPHIENLEEVRRQMWLQDQGLKIQEALHIFGAQSLPALKRGPSRADVAGGSSVAVDGVQGLQA